MLRLVVKDTSGERSFASERNEILIGRRDGADLQLGDERACSRNHCMLRVEGDRIRLIDLGSANGTSVGANKVTQAVLDLGDEFRIGTTVMRVAAFDGPALAAAPLALDKPARAARGAGAPLQAPVPKAHTDDFAREVRAMVSKAPWYFTSLVAHVIILLILDLVAFKVRTEDPRTAMAAVQAEELAEAEIDTSTDIDVKDIAPELDAAEEELEIDEPVSEAVKKNPADTSDVEYDDIVAPDHIGISKGRRFKISSPLPVAKTAGADEVLNKGDLHGEQGRARDVVQRDLGQGLKRARAKLGRKNIIVVEGDFDKIEKILDQYEWPYTLIDRMTLINKRFPEAKILFINCARRPGPGQRKKLVPIVKSLVRRGCWVVTSDWSVDPYLVDGFPEHVKKLEHTPRQSDTTVTVKPVAHDPLLKGVFPRRGQSVWWLEETSTMVRATDKVKLLVASQDMRKRYGSEDVVFKFKSGKGLVIHLLGHFYQKDGNRRGLVAMHRLINNVILERVNPTN